MRNCGNCKAWLRLDHLSRYVSETGDCRRFAPRANPGDIRRISWPVTGIRDGCMEFMPLPRKAPKKEAKDVLTEV